jgi:hypothetical protein
MYQATTIKSDDVPFLLLDLCDITNWFHHIVAAAPKLQVHFAQANAI